MYFLCPTNTLKCLHLWGNGCWLVECLIRVLETMMMTMLLTDLRGSSVGADSVWLCWNAGTREYDDIAVLNLTSRPPTSVYPCSTPSLIPSHFSVVPPPQVIHRPLNRLQQVPWGEQGTKVGRIQGPTNTSLPCYIRRLVADILVFKVGLGDKKSVWQPSPPAEQGRQGTGDLSQQKNFKEKYSKTYVGDGGQKGNYPKPHNLNHLPTKWQMLGQVSDLCHWLLLPEGKWWRSRMSDTDRQQRSQSQVSNQTGRKYEQGQQERSR